MITVRDTSSLFNISNDSNTIFTAGGPDSHRSSSRKTHPTMLMINATKINSKTTRDQVIGN